MTTEAKKLKEVLTRLVNNEEALTAIVEAQVAAWREENEELGQLLGYPQCCIDAFCQQPPLLMQIMGTDHSDELRYDASHINGVYTGFIPCIEHAKQVLSGEVQLSDLIDNRSSDFEAFPNF